MIAIQNAGVTGRSPIQTFIFKGVPLDAQRRLQSSFQKEKTEMQTHAIRIMEKHRAALCAVDIPDHPGPKEVLARALFTLISPGTELAAYTGHHSHTDEPGTHYPVGAGYAFVGIVEEVGEAVKDAGPGDTIFAQAGHQRKAVISQEIGWVKVPDGLDPRRAVFARMALVASSSVLSSQRHVGDRCATVGLGLVGNLGGQVAKALGLKICGIDISPGRREKALQCGYHLALDPSEAGFEAKWREFTCDQGFDLVLEATGRAEGGRLALHLARTYGEVFQVGTPWQQESDVSGLEIMRAVFLKYLTYRGGWEWRWPRTPAPWIHGSLNEHTLWLMEQIAEGRIVVEPLLTDILPAEDCDLAYRRLLEEPEKHIGVLLEWG